jgi:hypothetical protein
VNGGRVHSSSSPNQLQITTLTARPDQVPQCSARVRTPRADGQRAACRFQRRQADAYRRCNACGGRLQAWWVAAGKRRRLLQISADHLERATAILTAVCCRCPSAAHLQLESAARTARPSWCVAVVEHGRCRTTPPTAVPTPVSTPLASAPCCVRAELVAAGVPQHRCQAGQHRCGPAAAHACGGCERRRAARCGRGVGG